MKMCGPLLQPGRLFPISQVGVAEWHKILSFCKSCNLCLVQQEDCNVCYLFLRYGAFFFSLFTKQHDFYTSHLQKSQHQRDGAISTSYFLPNSALLLSFHFNSLMVAAHV